MVKVFCPSCRGAKEEVPHSLHRGCRSDELACDFCKGEGPVSTEASERWHKGHATRDARVKQILTLLEQAALLGIEPILLNDIDPRKAFVERVESVGALQSPAPLRRNRRHIFAQHGRFARRRTNTYGHSQRRRGLYEADTGPGLVGRVL
jgi:hypothetical protein